MNNKPYFILKKILQTILIKLDCFFCIKLFDNAEDLLHHLQLDHQGMTPNTLQEATAARETKKQLGDYLDITKKGVGIECPTCFELFNGIENLITHAKKSTQQRTRPKICANTTRNDSRQSPNPSNV